MTGQSLLNIMEVLNQDLQLQSGEADVSYGLIALNVAQDYFESLAATHVGFKGDTTGTVATTASQEYSTFPSGVLRIDALYMLNSSTSRPEYKLRPIRKAGGHAPTSAWPHNLTTSTPAGKPTGYFADGGRIWWNRLPDATHTVRWYGFQTASDITAGGTFAYDDIVAFPLASLAVKIMRLGVDDPIQDIGSIALEAFKPVIEALSNFNRDGAIPFEYTRLHTE